MSNRNDLRNAINRLKRAEAAMERATASGAVPAKLAKLAERISTARSDIAAIRAIDSQTESELEKAETDTPDDYVASGAPDSLKEEVSDTPTQAGGGASSDKFQSDLRAEVSRWADDVGRRSGSIVIEIASARWLIEGAVCCGVFDLKFPGLKAQFTEAGGPAGTWRAAAAFGARLVEAPDAIAEAAAARNQFIERANKYLAEHPIELDQFGEAVSEVASILRRSFEGGWRKFDLALSGRGEQTETETESAESAESAETESESAESAEAVKLSASEVAAIFVTESDQAAITQWVAGLSGEACLKLITALAERRNELTSMAS